MYSQPYLVNFESAGLAIMVDDKCVYQLLTELSARLQSVTVIKRCQPDMDYMEAEESARFSWVQASIPLCKAPTSLDCITVR